MNIDQLLQTVAMERGLRQSTVYAYQGFFKRLGIVDDSMSKDELESLLLSIDNINSRRAAAMAVRSVLGVKVHVPAARPKRYDLPVEDTPEVRPTFVTVRNPWPAHDVRRVEVGGSLRCHP
jgi:hypothetical protein